MTQHLKARDVARTALREWDRLGAVRGKAECLYDYGDGAGCAIGVSLTERTLQDIKKLDDNDENVVDLVKHGVATTDDLNLLFDIQAVHDAVVTSFSLGWRPGDMRSAIGQRYATEHFGRPVTLAHLREFLTLVAEETPA